MGYGLKKLKEIEAERKARREEKERIKKEKEEAKKQEKRAKRKKKLKSQQNKRAYAKRRKVQLDERKKKGDEFGYFMVLITKNNKRVKRLCAKKWKTDAYQIYTEAIEKNKATVKMPLLHTTCNHENLREKRIRDVKYEIILVQTLQNPEETDLVKQFKDENGKFVDNKIIDSDKHVILAKNEWLIEELFYVYGYHPEKDRKNFDFILNEIVLHNSNDKYDSRQILTYQNKVLIKYLDDFDFIICKTPQEAQRLYNTLEKEILPMKLKYIFFCGEVGASQKSEWLNKLEEKTGWARVTCKKPTLI